MEKYFMENSEIYGTSKASAQCSSAAVGLYIFVALQPNTEFSYFNHYQCVKLYQYCTKCAQLPLLKTPKTFIKSTESTK